MIYEEILKENFVKNSQEISMQIEFCINRNDIASACSKIIAIGLYHDELKDAENIILKHYNLNDLNIKSSIIISFGHLARRFRKISYESLEILNSIIKNESNNTIKGLAQDAIDDLNHFSHLNY